MQAQISEELRPFQVPLGALPFFHGFIFCRWQDAMDWDGALSLLASVDPIKASCFAVPAELWLVLMDVDMGGCDVTG